MIKEPSKVSFTHPGLMSSVQDLGRKGLAHYGIPYSGAMDQFSFRKANHLLQNPEAAACLEMAHIGPEMVFESPTQIVFTGASCRIYNNLQEVPMNKTLEIRSGDRIKVSRFQKGQWCYMGIKYGIESETVAGSRSWYAGITHQNLVRQNDHLFYLSEERISEPNYSRLKEDTSWYEKQEIQVYPGPEWNLLDKKQKDILENKIFSVSTLQNRMGIQLEETVANNLGEILTAPVYPGTVQLTPSGRIIILMRDAQVTGGYPRILHVAEKSINVLAQKRSNESIKFGFT